MKALQITVGILVLAILGISSLMLYSMIELYILFAGRPDNMYGASLPNEFYITLISTIVLIILSIPTIIYQARKIVRKAPLRIERDDLIDDDDIQKDGLTEESNFLIGSTRFYSFALFTQIILLGKRLNLQYLETISFSHWIVFVGLLLAAFVASYFLTPDKKSK